MDAALRLEAVLTQHTKVGFSESFEEFFEFEHERLLRAMYLVTGYRDEAEDITQDAFVKVLERWESVRRMDAPTAYLYRTAMNTFRSKYRRGLIAFRRLALLATREGRPFDEVDVRQDVQEALSLLTPRQRAAIVLTELLGYTSDEAAQILQIKASTVRALATQARAALRSTMGDARE